MLVHHPQVCVSLLFLSPPIAQAARERDSVVCGVCAKVVCVVWVQEGSVAMCMVVCAHGLLCQRARCRSSSEGGGAGGSRWRRITTAAACMRTIRCLFFCFFSGYMLPHSM